MKVRLTAAAAFFSALAACSGGTDELNNQGGRFLSVIETLRSGLRGREELPTVDRTLLDGLTVPSLELSVPSRDGLAYLIPLISRTDARLGPLNIWTTADGSQVTLRSGVYVAMRGFGDDVTSTDRTGSIGFVTGQSGESWPMRLDIQTSANGVTTQTFRCTGQSQGRKTLEIIELTYPVEHLTENCSNDAGVQFSNDYFVDTRDGTVWQSKQWAGEKIGYIATRILKKP